MAVTRFVRKLKRNRAKASRRRTTLKLLNFKPVVKNVDIEELKSQFKSTSKKQKTEDKPTEE